MATEASRNGSLGTHRPRSLLQDRLAGDRRIHLPPANAPWPTSASTMKSVVWGCVDPNVTPHLNDPRDPRRSDPQWIATTSAEGQCVTISTRSIWEPLSADHNGLTYVAYRGTIGKPGSFWVPTAEIASTAPVETAPIPPPSAPTEAARTRVPQVVPAPVPTVAAPAIQVPATPDAAPQSSPVQEPEQAPAPSVPEAQTSGNGSSGGGGGVVVIVVLLLVAWSMRRISRRSKRSNWSPKAETKQASRADEDRSVNAGRARLDQEHLCRASILRSGDRAPVGSQRRRLAPAGCRRPASAVSSWPTAWSTSVATPSAITISSFLDPSLPVAGSSASAGPLGYWPSYGAITPECRRRYIEWLSSGKRDPDAPLGYIFLYFYGLERRLLLEEPTADEVRLLVAEIERLRTIYAGSGSFEGYSRRLVEAVGFLKNSASLAPEPYVPDLEALPNDMPLALKVAIAQEVAARRPLGFELSAAALFGLRDFWSENRHATGKARPAFLALLRLRFQEGVPDRLPAAQQEGFAPAAPLPRRFRRAVSGPRLQTGG